MDIKPVKRRRKTVRQPTRPASGSKEVILKNNSLSLSSKKTDKPRLASFLKKNIFLVIIFAFLCILYLPASKFIDTNGQYQSLINQSSSVEIILKDAVYMPQKFFLFITQSNGLSNTFLLKAYTFIFSVLVVYLFYKACLRWLGRSTAIITTLLFSSSTWMILSSQSLSFSNIYLVFVPLVIYLNYLLIQNRNAFKVFLATLLFSVALYSPGMVWPILGFIALLPLFMQKILAKYNLNNIWILLVLTFVMILPLFVSFILHPSNFSHVMAGEGQTTIYVFVRNLQDGMEAMFLNGITKTDLWLIGTPVFNYLTSFLFLFGLVFLFTEKDLNHRSNFIAVSLLFSLLTIAFVGLPALSIIIPAVYITAGFGIKFLLNNWYGIFPNNPVARNVGLSLVIFVVLLSSGYNITRYYIAWPKAKELLSEVSSEKNI